MFIETTRGQLWCLVLGIMFSIVAGFGIINFDELTIYTYGSNVPLFFYYLSKVTASLLIFSLGVVGLFFLKSAVFSALECRKEKKRAVKNPYR